jgi:hypothetical protein
MHAKPILVRSIGKVYPPSVTAKLRSWCQPLRETPPKGLTARMTDSTGERRRRSIPPGENLVKPLGPQADP